MHRPRIVSNLIGNFAGRGISAALSFLLVPVYVHYLGVEAYGLVGVLTTLHSVFSLLNFSLNTTTSRELAMSANTPERWPDARNLMRTVETIYWSIGIVIGLLVLVASPLIAERWLKPEALSVGTVHTAVAIIGVMLAFQWPVSFYEGALMGLQRLVALNAVQATLQLMRGLGAVAVVWSTRSIVAFFIWQLCMTAITVLTLSFFAWRFMPEGPRPRFSIDALKRIWRFAAEVSVTGLVAVLMTQTDKIIISRQLSLVTFGYYTLALTAAASLYYLAYPITSAYFPRFAQLFAAGEGNAALVRTYHSAAQLLSVMVVPAALLLSFFAPELMLLWTRNPVTASNTATIASVLAIGMMLNSFFTIPHAMQVAYGWTRVPIYVNLIAVAIQIPLLITAIDLWGALGAACAWVLLNAGYVLIAIPIAHMRVLPGEKWRWYFDDILKPAMGALVVIAAARLLVPPELLKKSVGGLAILAVVGLTAMATAAMAAPIIRNVAFSRIALWRAEGRA